MNWVDVLAIILFARTGYVGYHSGLGPELLKLTGLVGGIFVGFGTDRFLGKGFSDWTTLRLEWAQAMVMALVVVGVYWGLTRVLRLLEGLVQVTFEGRLTRLGGLLTGWVRGALVVSVFLVICRQLPSDYLDASIDQHSLSGPRLARMAPAVYDGISGLPKTLLTKLR